MLILGCSCLILIAKQIQSFHWDINSRCIWLVVYLRTNLHGACLNVHTLWLLKHALVLHPDSFWRVYFTPSHVQEKLEQSPKRDIEGMGVAEIKYGDSLCFIMHVATGLWLSYQAPDVKSARLGPLKRRVSGDKHKHTPSCLQMQSTYENKPN